MRIEDGVKLDFKDVLIRPKRSTLKSRGDVSLERTFLMRHAKEADGTTQRKLCCVPVVAANMDTTGTFEMAAELARHKVLTAVHKHYSVEQWTAFATAHADALPYVCVSTGALPTDLDKTAAILAAVPAVTIVCLDVANGYTESFVEAVRDARRRFANHVIIAGNVCTGEMTEELILSGADIVKVGIGPGSVCTTRVVTGVGYPQLSAVIECADAAHGLGGCIVSDGGCTSPGDVAKAFGGGADFVMLGGYFAGHDESGGELYVADDGRKYKRFYGMSSAEAQVRHTGKLKEYRAAEGKSTTVPYRGPVRDSVLQLLGGVRSACTYVGAAQLKELSKRTTFVRVTQTVNQVFGESKGVRGEAAAKAAAASSSASGGGAAAADGDGDGD
eukprot:CAMPEP_0198317110 /NCGR_PEP_ID=MMETSP1450-20131203/6715_1 /TAXON_ID=753684 ORGANISM="Madagascaria erythrocladiodes, Strain CCMP3234" /NCGR_SAMPLE_ID=MMETSP1450 /ASSEMBLY_ACC=CAM_ASM_001115 /LENGTH=387 /DNA_ID=CAMNT_0044020293 /DNA_START=73 /DNA_END=1233 /DNA_ORIENTATION=+